MIHLKKFTFSKTFWWIWETYVLNFVSASSFSLITDNAFTVSVDCYLQLLTSLFKTEILSLNGCKMSDTKALNLFSISIAVDC